MKQFRRESDIANRKWVPLIAWTTVILQFGRYFKLIVMIVCSWAFVTDQRLDRWTNWQSNGDTDHQTNQQTYQPTNKQADQCVNLSCCMHATKSYNVRVFHIVKSWNFFLSLLCKPDYLPNFKPFINSNHSQRYHKIYNDRKWDIKVSHFSSNQIEWLCNISRTKSSKSSICNESD